MKKIGFIISDIDKALAFEWVAEHLDQKKFEQFYILVNPGPTYLESFLKEKGLKVYRLEPPSGWRIFSSIRKTLKILKQEKPQIVHCHLYQANRVGLIASYLGKVKKRIYTRHFSTYHHLFHPRAVFLDKILNRLSTDIVAISSNVRDVLVQMEKVKPEKVHLILHGFDLELFKNISEERVQKIKDKYRIPENKFTIGVIARFTFWKGVQEIISAFERFNKKNPESHLVLANAQGDYATEIHLLLDKLPYDSFSMIEFEYDMPALYKVFDVYVHTPIDDHSEAFGQTYVESQASGIPGIFTLSGIAKEFIVDQENALVVPFKDSGSIEKGLDIIHSGGYRKEWIEKGKSVVYDLFPLPKMIKSLEDLYSGKK